MWWELTAAGLAVITLLVVTAMTLLGMVGLAAPLMFGHCRQCWRFMLDFRAAPEGAICHRCRHGHPPRGSALLR
jgi:hypothetical protein